MFRKSYCSLSLNFGFTTVHGVLSWINAENRKAIQRFVLKKIKPGGILYLSYNCLPKEAVKLTMKFPFGEARGKEEIL
jgi:hypothetical protein